MLQSLFLILTTLLLNGCATQEVHVGAPLDVRARWALLPIANHAETAQAGERVQAMLMTLLRNRGVTEIQPSPEIADNEGLPELNDQRRLEAARTWVKQQGYTYGVTGSVEEWRYKSGTDGEPAAAVSLQVIDIATGQVVWSATGARTGWGRESVSGVAQKLLKDLLHSMPLK
ncbi:MAG: hypothetical protein IDH49_13290 [Gammaproteobacteria bacterium]|nr:hypothetical protein [Gammaproteobacteria bacterium]